MNNTKALKKQITDSIEYVEDGYRMPNLREEISYLVYRIKLIDEAIQDSYADLQNDETRVVPWRPEDDEVFKSNWRYSSEVISGALKLVARASDAPVYQESMQPEIAEDRLPSGDDRLLLSARC